MKIKGALAVFMVALSVALPACSPAAPTITPTAPPPTQLTNANWDLVLVEAQGAQTAYIGLPVTLTGQVRQILFATGMKMQMVIDTKSNSSLGEDTLIRTAEVVDVSQGESVTVVGILETYWTTTSAGGNEIKIPVVVADNVTVIAR